MKKIGTKTISLVIVFLMLVSTATILVADEYEPMDDPVDVMAILSGYDIQVGETFTIGIWVDPNGNKIDSVSTDRLYWDPGFMKLEAVTIEDFIPLFYDEGDEEWKETNNAPTGESVYSPLDSIAVGATETWNYTFPFLLSECDGELTYVRMLSGSYSLRINGYEVANVTGEGVTNYNLDYIIAQGAPVDTNYIEISVTNRGGSSISAGRLYMADALKSWLSYSAYDGTGGGNDVYCINPAYFANLTFIATGVGTCTFYIAESICGYFGVEVASSTTNCTVNISYGSQPAVTNPNPANGLTGVDKNIASLSVLLNDADGDPMNWSIECSNGDGTSGTRGNGTASLTLTTLPLSYDTEYTWWVNVTDGYNPVNHTFTFTVRSQYQPNPPSGLGATPLSKSQIRLDWSKGANATRTYIMAKQEGYPADRDDGSNIYNGTGVTYTHGGLGADETWYYKAWCYNAVDNTWSSDATTTETTFQNYLPEFGTPSPTNGSTGNAFSFVWSIPITDANSEDTISWTIESTSEHSSSGDNQAGGTKTLSVSGLAPETWYTVYVNATDGVGWTREWFTFQTLANQPPAYGTPSPTNGSIDQSIISVLWSIPITDADGDSFNWTIECSNGQWASESGQTNGTKQLTITNLDFDTTYTVWVNSTDSGSGQWTRKWFVFTTVVLEEPSGFTATADGRFAIDLEWINNDYADKTLVRGKLGSYPSDVTDGTFIYNGTAEAATHDELSPGENWYYRAWSWNETKEEYSVFANANEATDSNIPSTIDSIYPQDATTNLSISYENGNITIYDAEGDQMSMTIHIGVSWEDVELVYSGTSLTNGTYTFNPYEILGEMEYDTEYGIAVNITDGFDWTNETFVFSTGIMITEILDLIYLNSTGTGYNFIAVLNSTATSISLGEKLLSENISWEYITYWDSSEQEYSSNKLINNEGTLMGDNFTMTAGDVVLIAMLQNLSFEYGGFSPTMPWEEIAVTEGFGWLGRTGESSKAYDLGVALTGGGLEWTQMLYYNQYEQGWSNAFLPTYGEGHTNDFTITTGMAIMVGINATGTFMMGGW